MDRDEFITKNHNLIYSFASSHHLDLDEYYDLLAIALIKAVDSYKEEKGIKFSAYAYVIMGNHVSTHIKHIKRDSLTHTMSLDYDINEETKLIDIIAPEEKIKKTIVLPNALSDREKEVLALYLQGHSKREISIKLKINPNKVRAIMDEIKIKLKRVNKK